jgi:hypothetical protein
MHSAANSRKSVDGFATSNVILSFFPAFLWPQGLPLVEHPQALPACAE